MGTNIGPLKNYSRDNQPSTRIQQYWRHKYGWQEYGHETFREKDDMHRRFITRKTIAKRVHRILRDAKHPLSVYEILDRDNILKDHVSAIGLSQRMRFMVDIETIPGKNNYHATTYKIIGAWG